MRHRLLRSFVAIAIAAAASAQTNTIVGLDARLTDNAGPLFVGRRGPAFPNGEIALAYSYTLCNAGSVNIAWVPPMHPSHPMFAMMVVREANGRFEQITTDATTYVKHGFSAANDPSTCGGTCAPPILGPGLRPQCSDTYTAGTNANRHYLGPASEIDPWTGVWTPVGSYFDRGDPEVAPPQNTDGQRSLMGNGPVFQADPVKNRITLREPDLLAASQLWMCCHVVVPGEHGDLRFDNLGHRQLQATPNLGFWSFGNPAPFTSGSVLAQWSGASLAHARNGDDDGHFLVAGKVTPIGGALWHYEYAVHNFDNRRGGASLRIPVCPTTIVTNVTFRDPNGDPLDDWTHARFGAELVFSAPAGNALAWNNIFNFGFDCDIGPQNGDVAIDQALLGPGALTVHVAAPVPSGLAAVTALGPGCGAPAPSLGTAAPLPLIPDPGFAFTWNGAPNAAVYVFAAFDDAAIALAPGCMQWLAPDFFPYGAYLTDGTGAAMAPAPIPNIAALEGRTCDWQGVEVVPGGPFLGFLQVSNGLELRLATR
jgi:hypothetical protein